tara:strand:- start:81 stop:341 length:261 start_codon:yes stop_codon:yes gene_type:complete
MPKTQLISCVKDEAVFMLEWVAHHHLLGFDDICIYTNDCTDGTVALLSALEDAGYCRRFDNPVGEKFIRAANHLSPPPPAEQGRWI